ncbi:MAG: protein-glutamate O-methyltransferase CheR [Desulfobulbales bacterium]|nr:protein-glutamate O-methyltransferase CheR [Desulfobulbales bacterium]
MMTMSDREFQLLRDLVYTRLGINLTERKRSMLIGRLQKLLRTSGFKTFQEYYDHLVQASDTDAMTELVNRVTTNYSFFYRGKSHFDFFSQRAFPEILNTLRKRNSRDIRIWTAGCSTGEEPYMIIMLMMEYLGREYGLWDGGILATDISAKALRFAQEGIYPGDRAKELPSYFKKRYFTVMPDSQLAVKDVVKKEVLYRKFNLKTDSFPFKKPFQIIFCRNVMIYFDRQTRDELLQQFYKVTEPGGYLFIGHSETLGRDQDYYKYIMPAVYQKI